jgi:hypothetical protein
MGGEEKASEVKFLAANHSSKPPISLPLNSNTFGGLPEIPATE